MGTRLAVGSRTCLLSAEHDPSRLLSMSTGKLVRYLVEDGGHVEVRQRCLEEGGHSEVRSGGARRLPIPGASVSMKPLTWLVLNSHPLLPGPPCRVRRPTKPMQRWR